MFGYVVPRKHELKIKEYNLYKTVYCSLCRALKKRCGRCSALFLNYDFVFLSILGLALSEETPKTVPGRCAANPLKKQVFYESEVLDYCAHCLVISVYHKLSDDIKDEGFFKKGITLIARLVLSRPYKKAKLAHNDVDAAITENIWRQRRLELAEESVADAACDPTARSLSSIFGNLADDEAEKRVLSRLGYLLGRFVYLADAGDDLRDDISKKRYNPFINRFAPAAIGDTDIQNCIEEIKEQLMLTRGEIAACYNLLEPFRYRAICDNIIFFGLEDAAAAIGSNRKKQP